MGHDRRPTDRCPIFNNRVKLIGHLYSCNQCGEVLTVLNGEYESVVDEHNRRHPSLYATYRGGRRS